MKIENTHRPRALLPLDHAETFRAPQEEEAQDVDNNYARQTFEKDGHNYNR